VIHQDGTCNGIQHASALLQDKATAFAVNCTAAGTDLAPQDVYGMVAVTAAEKLATYPELAAMLTRDVCKKPVMVTGYGASEGTVDAAIAAKLPTLSADELRVVCEAIHAAIGVHAAAVVRMTATLNEQITDFLERTGKQELTWRTPDGMIIKQRYMDEADKVIIQNGFKFSLTKNKYLVALDIDKMARAASPNFIHSLDAAHLRAVVRECEHELVAIHDSVGSHPATFFETNAVIRDEFVKIHANNPMKTFEKWNEVKVAKTGDFDVNEVYNSTYLFS
jgi:DNA-directed RNA polymerase